MREYFVLLLRTGRWRVALLLALMVSVGLTEGVSVLLLVPLLQVAGLEVQGGEIQEIADSIAQVFRGIGMTPSLPAVLAMYIGVVVARAGLQRTEAVAAQKLQHDLTSNLRSELYEAITRSRWVFFSRSRSSDFAHVLTSEIDRVGALTAYSLRLIVQLLMAAVYLGIAIHLSPWATLVAIGSGLSLLMLLRRGVARSRHTGEELSSATNRLYAATLEHLGGMKTTKSYGAEGRNIATFEGGSRAVADAYVSAGRVHAASSMWFQVGSVVILAGVLFVAVDVLHLSVASVLLLLFLFGRLVPQFSGIQRTFQYLTNVLPSFRTVLRTLRQCRTEAEARAANAEEAPFERSVALAGVTFGYREKDAPALHAVDLTIPAKQTVAIVGQSGAGKSTIADLLLGLLVPTSGSVLIDDEELIPARLKAWRDSVGYVAQDTVLFHASVRANLSWGTPGATEEEMWTALRHAAADEFALRLPEGLDTVIGDRGVQLSGGERQRIALARALLRKPSLLILDEATSSLDSENERRIQAAIDRLHGELTLLIITHRLDTIRSADRIYLIEDGKVVDVGTWVDLSLRSARFRTLLDAPGAQEPSPEGLELVG